MPNFPRINLKKGREKPLLRGHPWVFSGAVESVEGEIAPGDIGEVYSIGGKFLGMGHLNPRSQIFFRLLTSQKQEIGDLFFRERMVEAFRLREHWLKKTTNAYRVVNGEGDFLPGLIVDRYGDVLVIQSLTAGVERLKGLFVKILIDELHPKCIYERSDVATRGEEGLNEFKGLLYGEDVREGVEIEEGGCTFSVKVKEGQKTGFYLDQRENRRLLQKVSQGKSILDVCCYTGAFSIHAGRGGAEGITLIDSSQEALETAEIHFQWNRLERIPRRLIRGDAFVILRSLQPEFDIAVVDPPPFAKKKGDILKASRGYKDINLQAFRLLKREGLLFTFSCSHYMDWDLFQKVVFAAAVDAGKKVQFLGRMGHPADHPVNLSHPEGEYLRGFICRVL